MPDYAGLDRLQRALNPLPGAAVDGVHQMNVTGTVNIIGGGSGGTSMTDDTAFTPGSTAITPAGGYFGPRTVSSGHAAAPALSNSAIMLVDVRAGGAGGGVANLTVRGSANSDLHVGYASGAGINVDGGAYVPILGTVNTVGGTGLGTVGVYGSVGAYGTMAVYGSPANPVYNVGSVNVVNNVGILGSVQAGIAVQGTGGTVYNVGYASNNSGAWPNYNGGAWLPVMFPSGFYATVNVTGSLNQISVVGSVNITGSINPITGSVNITGSINPVGIFGSVGVFGSVSVTGSVNITGSINPVGVFGSVGVYGSVSVLGSVNIGGVPKVDTSASITPSMWVLSTAVSGNLAVVNAGSLSSNPGNNQIKFYNITLISEQTCNMIWQSPSGTNISGSVQLLPGAGFVVNGSIKNPILIAGAGGTININSTGTGHIGGWAMGYVE